MAGAVLGNVPDSGHDKPGAYAWLVFAIIAALGFVDWLVRQIVIGILPQLKLEWQLSDSKIGLLAAIVPIMVSLAMLPLALVIDQWSRVKTIFLMALIWSLATVACGFATSYNQLLVARAFIGLGEAAYGPAGFALLAWYFPLRLRSTVIGGVLVVAALGNVMGIALGGTLAQQWGWQNTFIAAGCLSLIVSLFALTIKDYPTAPLASGGSAAAKITYAMRTLLRSPTVNLTYLGSASLLFIMSALVTWLPTYLGRFYGYTIAHASQTGAVGVALTAIGAVLWGQAADRWGVRNARGRLWVPAIGALSCAMVLLAALTLFNIGSGRLILLLAVFFFAAVVMGPVNTVVMDVIEPGLRASASALVGLAQNLLGLAAGPIVVGLLADLYGLEAALLVLPVFAVMSFVFFMLASRTYPGERAVIHGI